MLRYYFQKNSPTLFCLLHSMYPGTGTGTGSHESRVDQQHHCTRRQAGMATWPKLAPPESRTKHTLVARVRAAASQDMDLLEVTCLQPSTSRPSDRLALARALQRHTSTSYCRPAPGLAPSCGLFTFIWLISHTFSTNK